MKFTKVAGSIALLGVLCFGTAVTSSFAAEIVLAPKMKILVNNQLYTPPAEAIMHDGQLYLPVRGISQKLGAAVTWNNKNQTAIVSTNGKSILCNGVMQQNTLMASKEFFSNAFNADIKYYTKENLVLINSTKKTPPLADAINLLATYSGYTETDLYWLSRIVEAEATGETYASKLGVANVIINRKNHSLYPSTIKAVIFDRKYGVQFTPISNGTVYNTPSATSRIAAIEALEGRNNASDTLFFLNPRYATSSWVQNNRKYAFTIGGHNYYY